MAKRFALIVFVTLIAVVVVAPAAIAAPSTRSVERHDEIAVMHDAKAVQHANANAQQAGNGKSHAAENAGRGMNRVGSLGAWGINGHVPSPISFPQGHSLSDPDGNANGGLDKPGQTGGFDADRDGNNGCGNDSDREDDANGWCGHRPVAGPPPPGGGGTGGGSAPTPTVVLPKRTERPAALPRTGADVGDFLWGGWSLVLVGSVLRRTGHKLCRR